MDKNKFDFDDIVIVNSNKKDLKEINQCEGVIRGKAQNEQTGFCVYGVSIYKDGGKVWRVKEEDLQKVEKKAEPNINVEVKALLVIPQ